MSSVVVETFRLADFSCLFPSLLVTCGLRQISVHMAGTAFPLVVQMHYNWV